jgi:GDP/UDP-N,N'-diacetylbacillosamine 2-epimerase (hydrolysing)
VVNIGDRQRLRERNANVTDVVANRDAIGLVLRTVLTHGRWPCENVYGDGRAGERIAQLLRTLPFGPAVIEKVNAY